MIGHLAILPHFHAQAHKLFLSLAGKRKVKAFIDWQNEKTGPSYEIEEGIAEIYITGPLYECEAWLELFGICSYQRIRKQVFEANLDPNVTGIKLIVDSPGGSVDGAFETQKTLSASAKPILESEVLTMCCSAAYLLAGTAQKITAGGHSTVGSIGTILTYYGDKGFLAKMGITRTTLVSSVSPNKNDDPEDVGDEGRQRLQAWVDSLGQVFAERVAQLRKVPVETVLANYGKGGVFVGTGALTAGLIDALTDTEPAAQEGNMAETTTTTTTETETTETEAADSTLAEETAGEAVESPDAVGKELDRMKAIDDLKLVGYDSLVYAAKYETKISAEQLKAQVFDATRDRQGKAKAAVVQAAEAQKKKPVVSANAEELAQIEENEKLRAMAKKEAAKRH